MQTERNKTLKENLQRVMDDRGVTAYRLCEDSGVYRSRVSDILRGKTTNPKVETLTRLAGVLDVSVDELLPDYRTRCEK